MKATKALTATVLIVVLIVLAALSVHADVIIAIDGYRYKDDGNGLASIVGYDIESDTMDVPAKISSVYVSEIADAAFQDDDYIKELIVDNAVRMYRIGDFSFSRSALEGNLTIPYHVTSVGVSAFERTNLSSISFNSNGGIVPAQCFQYCTTLSSASLGLFIQKIDRYAFRGCSSLTYIMIPETVTDIHSTSFTGCNDLVINCYTDSYAHKFAEENGIDYVLIDAPTPTDPTVPTEPTTVTEATVPTETAATEPSVATEPPTTAPECYILGDVDNSGNVDVVDATFAQRYVTQSEIPAEILKGIDVRADVDSSGDVEATDVTFIMRHLIRVKVPYPIGELITI